MRQAQKAALLGFLRTGSRLLILFIKLDRTRCRLDLARGAKLLGRFTATGKCKWEREDQREEA